MVPRGYGIFFLVRLAIAHLRHSLKSKVFDQTFSLPRNLPLSLVTHSSYGQLSSFPPPSTPPFPPHPSPSPHLSSFSTQKVPFELRCGSICRKTLPLASSLNRHQFPPILSSNPFISQPSPKCPGNSPGELINKNVNDVISPREALSPRRYHSPLIFCRALSTAPATWWGVLSIITLSGELFSLSTIDGANGRHWSVKWNHEGPWQVETRFKVTEASLSILWCCASAYLSYFFTDCLMSRWLLIYTPQATLIRLIATAATNGYITSWVIHLFGASNSSCQMLPAWISIASTLTVLYHLTQRHTNIRKETSASISVFSIASFISMISLLLQLYIVREQDEAEIPLVAFADQVWDKVKVMVKN